MTNSDLHNFADDNTISCSANTLNELLQNLEKEANLATQWFKDNSMIVNPDKFEVIITDRKKQNNNPPKMTIDEKVVTSSNKVTLLGLDIDSKLNFDDHISKICNKSDGQLNALCRLGHFFGLEERNIITVLFMQILITVHLFGILLPKCPQIKLRIYIKER